jgi:hypothetical protein
MMFARRPAWLWRGETETRRDDLAHQCQAGLMSARGGLAGAVELRTGLAGEARARPRQVLEAR